MVTGNRIRFDPEPITWHVPPSQRGHLEAAPEQGHLGLIRVWLVGDESAAAPRSLVLTHADIRRLCAVLHRLIQAGQTPGGLR